jgi:sorting nexin-8
MSLFGDSATATSPARGAKTSSSLFDDQTPARNSASLFADDHATENADSPWGFSSTKRAARGTLIKTLLPASDVPENYIDVFDQLAADSSSHNSLTPETVKRILSGSGIDEESKSHIQGIVFSNEGKELSRGETNVLLALIGLVQEGEEPTLDGVDERRKGENFWIK